MRSRPGVSDIRSAERASPDHHYVRPAAPGPQSFVSLELRPASDGVEVPRRAIAARATPSGDRFDIGPTGLAYEATRNELIVSETFTGLVKRIALTP